MQWVCILVVSGGLGLSVLDSVKAGSQITVGATLIIVGSFLHAVMYALSEYIAVKGREEDKIPPHIHCSTMASLETFILLCWQFIYTIPHWDEAIGDPMEKAGTSTMQAILILSAIAFANWLHSATFFYLLKWVGAVSSAVMKGLQAVLVFVMADIIFCNRQSNQCFDTYKVISLVVVVGGVLAYAFVTSRVTDAHVRSKVSRDTAWRKGG